jgi:hypothetical protein
MECEFCNRQYASRGSFRAHLKTKKHIEKKQHAYDRLCNLSDEIKLEVDESEHLSNLMLKYLVAEKIFDKFIEYDDVITKAN